MSCTLVEIYQHVRGICSVHQDRKIVYQTVQHCIQEDGNLSHCPWEPQILSSLEDIQTHSVFHHLKKKWDNTDV